VFFSNRIQREGLFQNMRTIAIGDIHGCVKALQGLIDVLEPTAQDRLIFLGDYVDRGPDSKGVIDLLLNLQTVCETVFLLGNHEIMFRGVLSGLPADLWLQIGGKQTVTSYGGLLTSVPPQHTDFLYGLRNYFETDHHIFVHANYSAHLPMSDQPEQALFWDHLTDYLPAPHFSGKHVFLGHTPQAGGEVGHYHHLTCLDTCCFGGYWLTAMDVNTRECWQISREGHLRQNWRTVKLWWRKIQEWKLRRSFAKAEHTTPK
jgi:serine/threonine protein phosphatase 1